MKKTLISALLASTMLVSAVAPAAAGFNPVTIDDSSSKVNIEKVIFDRSENKGIQSGVIGAFAYVVINGKIYSYALNELRKEANPAEAFRAFVAEQYAADQVGVLDAEIHVAEQAILDALLEGEGGPSVIELAKAKLTYLRTKREFIGGQLELEGFAPVPADRMTEDQAAYFAALDEFVQDYVSNVVVTGTTDNADNSVVVHLSNGNSYTLDLHYDEADSTMSHIDDDGNVVIHVVDADGLSHDYRFTFANNYDAGQLSITGQWEARATVDSDGALRHQLGATEAVRTFRILDRDGSLLQTIKFDGSVYAEQQADDRGNALATSISMADGVTATYDASANTISVDIEVALETARDQRTATLATAINSLDGISAVVNGDGIDVTLDNGWGNLRTATSRSLADAGTETATARVTINGHTRDFNINLSGVVDAKGREMATALSTLAGVTATFDAATNRISLDTSVLEESARDARTTAIASDLNGLTGVSASVSGDTVSIDISMAEETARDARSTAIQTALNGISGLSGAAIVDSTISGLTITVDGVAYTSVAAITQHVDNLQQQIVDRTAERDRFISGINSVLSSNAAHLRSEEQVTLTSASTPAQIASALASVENLGQRKALNAIVGAVSAGEGWGEYSVTDVANWFARLDRELTTAQGQLTAITAGLNAVDGISGLSATSTTAQVTAAINAKVEAATDAVVVNTPTGASATYNDATNTWTVTLDAGYGNNNDAIDAAVNGATAPTGISLSSTGGVISVSFASGYGELISDNNNAIASAVNAVTAAGIVLTSTNGVISASLASGYGSHADLAATLTGVSLSGGTLGFDSGYGSFADAPIVTGTGTTLTFAGGSWTSALATGYGAHADITVNTPTGLTVSGTGATRTVSVASGYVLVADNVVRNDQPATVTPLAGIDASISGNAVTLSVASGYQLLTNAQAAALDLDATATGPTGLSFSIVDNAVTVSLASGYRLVNAPDSYTVTVNGVDHTVTADASITVDLTTDNNGAIGAAAGNLAGVSASNGVLSFDTGYGAYADVAVTAPAGLTVAGTGASRTVSVASGYRLVTDAAWNAQDADAVVAPIAGITALVSGNNVTLTVASGYRLVTDAQWNAHFTAGAASVDITTDNAAAIAAALTHGGTMYADAAALFAAGETAGATAELARVNGILAGRTVDNSVRDAARVAAADANTLTHDVTTTFADLIDQAGLDTALEEAYNDGYEDGYNDGYADGFDDGRASVR